MSLTREFVIKVLGPEVESRLYDTTDGGVLLGSPTPQELELLRERFQTEFHRVDCTFHMKYVRLNGKDLHDAKSGKYKGK